MVSEIHHSKNNTRLLLRVNYLRRYYCREEGNGGGHLVDTISLELEQLLQEVTIVAKYHC